MVMIDLNKKLIILFNCKNKKSTVDLDKFKSFVNINYKNEFKYEDGICPKLNDSVHSGVVVAHLVKLVMTNGNLEQFQDEID